jgi:hypothetical protein
LFLLTGFRSSGQSLADTIRLEVKAINKAYDSAFYLTFNVDMVYNSDTLYAGTDSADFKHSDLSGTYTFHRRNALYKLGNIEFLQNDSFTIAVYKEEKFLMVGRNNDNKASGSFLPTRSLVDSTMKYIAINFTFSMNTTDSSKFQITLNAIDTQAVYERIIIEYEPKSHYLSRIAYRVKDPDYGDNSSVSGPVRKADLVFFFRHYRVQEAGPSAFDERRYLFYDGPDTIVPANAYRDFTIYKNY